MPNRPRKPAGTGVVVQLPRNPKKAADPREAAFNTAFGARLAEAREDRGLTQRQIASALNVGYHAYKKYEYGHREFPLYLLRDLSTIIDKSISWLLTGRG